MKNFEIEFMKVLKSAKAYLETEKNSGCEETFFIKKNLYPENISLNEGQKISEMKKLVKEATLCRECALYKTRKNLVFGEGNLNARLMFVGEAPGRDEDLRGLPFVGRAGELLTKIIEAINLKRSEVYIGNILKCRPPENRFPSPTEIVTCRNFIRRQIEIIKPAVICTLGKCATQSLLNTEETISKLRGNFQNYNGIKVMPTYHPAYLLRNPSDKRLVWEDVKKIKAELSKTS